MTGIAPLLRLWRAAGATAPPRARSRRRSARAAILWLAVGVVFIHVAATLALDVKWPEVRDPEYGYRVASLRERTAEHPTRPLVLVMGSSRVAMGVKPDAWEAARPGTASDPLLFNMSTLGGGPVQELLALRRVYADGFRPPVVLLEYWPPLLHQDGAWAEANSIDVRRLGPGDRHVIRGYFPDPDETERRMRNTRLNVLHAHRERLIVQAAPDWVARPWQVEGAWAALDDWGWLPGMAPGPNDTAFRRRMTENQRPNCGGRLAVCAIHPGADRALRESVATARAHGSAVGFLFMPESTEFQTWYPPAVEQAVHAHLAALSAELGVPVINARNWMDDLSLVDGFHLSRAGAAAFTPRLGPAISAAFPVVGGKP